VAWPNRATVSDSVNGRSGHRRSGRPPSSFRMRFGQFAGNSTTFHSECGPESLRIHAHGILVITSPE
jgi:hypothetical protein